MNALAGIHPAIQLAFMQIMAGDPVAAGHALEACRKADVDRSVCLLIEGRMALLRNEWLLAHDLLQQSADEGVESIFLFDALIGLGKASYNLGLFAKAMSVFRRCVVIEPDNGVAWMELAASHAASQEWPEALACIERGVLTDPDNPDTQQSAGAIYMAWGATELAIGRFRKALELQPTHAHAEVALASALLRAGEWEEGWKRFETRWRLPTVLAPWWYKGFPLYTGDLEGLRGKRVLLRAEQGYGDTIQFARYVEPLSKIAGAIILEVQPGLERLMSDLPVEQVVVTRKSAYLDQVLPLPDSELPPYDVQTTLMSMPYLFGTLPDTVPPPVRLSLIAPSKREGIGVCWYGGARRDEPLANMVDQRRSIRKEVFQPVLDALPGCVSLQYEDLRERGVKDWYDTARIVNTLALVITVDTALAHLAGSLGVETILLNRFDTCWRWGSGIGETVWYPSMRMFRQPRLGDWDSVVRQVVRLIENGSKPD